MSDSIRLIQTSSDNSLVDNVVQGADIVRTIGVSYATPIMRQLYRESNAQTSTVFVSSQAAHVRDSQLNNKIRLITDNTTGVPTSTSTVQTANSPRPTTVPVIVLSSSSLMLRTVTAAKTSMSTGSSPVLSDSPIPFLLPVGQSITQLRSDDELTSLSWLQDSNLLQATPLSHVKSNGPTTPPDSKPKELRFKMASADSPATNPPRDIDVESPTSDFTEELVDTSEQEITLAETAHISEESTTYNPLVHTKSKPPYSFSSLIFMAIEACEEKALPVKDIYSWVISHFPFYMNAPNGWKNSVRHNLSLNKCFRKVDKTPNLGKGSLWMVDPVFRPNLVTALKKTGYPAGYKADNLYMASGSPRNHIDHLDNLKKEELNRKEEGKECSPERPQTRLEVPSLMRAAFSPNGSTFFSPNPELFPRLARRLEDVYADRSLFPEDIHRDDVDAAEAMMVLKHGPTILQEGHPCLLPENSLTQKIENVRYNNPKCKSKRKQFHNELVDPNNVFISTSPSLDHAYVSSTSKCPTDSSPSSGIDEAFSDESFDSVDARVPFAGTDALLNLASIATSLALRQEALQAKPHTSSKSTNKRKAANPCRAPKRQKLTERPQYFIGHNNNLIAVNKNRLDNNPR